MVHKNSILDTVGSHYIFLKYLNGRININYGGSDKIRYNVTVDNMNEAYKMITLIINQISPYKLHLKK